MRKPKEREERRPGHTIRGVQAHRHRAKRGEPGQGGITQPRKDTASGQDRWRAWACVMGCGEVRQRTATKAFNVALWPLGTWAGTEVMRVDRHLSTSLWRSVMEKEGERKVVV